MQGTGIPFSVRYSTFDIRYWIAGKVRAKDILLLEWDIQK